MSGSDVAISYFRQGFSCSQAVAAAVILEELL